MRLPAILPLLIVGILAGPVTGWLKPVLASPGRLERLEQWVRPEVLGAVAMDPAAHPLVAWPLANLGLWLESLAGDRAEIGSGR